MKKFRDITDFKAESEQALAEYKYQKNLTEELDAHPGDFTDITILKIVLWKTNRYPTLDNNVINDINDLRRDYSDEKAKNILRILLRKDFKGFDLPMASTLLRFAVPNHLQIIDQRAYRFITDQDNLDMPKSTEEKIELYFNYIVQLRRIHNETGVAFQDLDRVLYALDKSTIKALN